MDYDVFLIGPWTSSGMSAATARVREALTELLASRNLESIAFQSAVEYLRFGNLDVPS